MRYILLVCIHLIFYSVGNATIDVMIKTSESIVFASDSRISTSGERVYTDSYEKIVPVCKTVILQMQGKAYIGNKSFKSYIKEFCIKSNISLDDEMSISEFNSRFVKQLNMDKQDSVDFGDLLISIAGIDTTGQLRLFGIRPKKDTVVTERFKNNYDIYFFGMTKVAEYLTMGYSSTEISSKKIISIIEKILKKDSLNCLDVDSSILKPIEVKIDSLLFTTGPKYHIGQLSTEDAIDFAYLIVKATIFFDKITYGNFGSSNTQLPITGGKIHICVLTHDGFYWVDLPR